MENFFSAQTQTEDDTFYIGRVAQMTGASRKAIRLYESLGLIPKPRRKGQYRVYSPRDVFLIHMIKTAQSVGFNLSELHPMVDQKVRHKVFPLKIANTLFDQKRTELRQKITAIRELEKRLLVLQKQMNRTFG